jgi:hypothetical protein
MHGPGNYRRTVTKRIARTKQQRIEIADRAVVAVFMQLQNIWRRQGTLRGVQSSREEREGWEQLIQCLANLPPPRN